MQQIFTYCSSYSLNRAAIYLLQWHSLYLQQLLNAAAIRTSYSVTHTVLHRGEVSYLVQLLSAATYSGPNAMP